MKNWTSLVEEHEGIMPNKVWLENKAENIMALFKPDTECNESAIEYEVYKIGRELGLPCVKIEIFTHNGKIGCLSYDYNKIIEGSYANDIHCAHADYLYKKGNGLTYNSKDSKGNTLDMIDEISMEIVKSQMPCIEKDVVNMLFLDCLVSNRDRHGCNWDVVMTIEGEVIGLAPLFDHAASLWNGYSPEYDKCLVLWEDGKPELMHFEMFERLSYEYPEQIKDLLQKCSGIEFIDFVAERYTKMQDIFERVEARQETKSQNEIHKDSQSLSNHSNSQRKPNAPQVRKSFEERTTQAKTRADAHNSQQSQTRKSNKDTPDL